MAFKKLLNLPTPSDPYEAARKIYVDNTATDVATDVVDKAMKQRTNLIAAHASYHGDLIKDEYQFTFGGSSVNSYKKHDMYNGFLMPHGGRIKRFVLEDFDLKFYSDIYEKSLDFVLNSKLDGVPFPIFTLVLIKNVSREGEMNFEKPEIVDLGTINIIFL